MSDRVRGKAAPEDSRKWKCNWINCLHGCGLAGNGRCSADGEWDNMSCGKFTKIPKHLYDKPQPEPMPLIKPPSGSPENGFSFEDGLEAHDQQVRKDFAEECIKTMPNVDFTKEEHIRAGLLQYETCVAHLREMAEGGR